MTYDEIVKDLREVKIKNYRRIWEPFMRKYQCERVCELGVYRGDHFMEMVKHNPKLAVAVDTWNNDGVHSSRDASYSKEELTEQLEYFKSLVDDLDFVIILKEQTAEAAKHYPDNYFDFVYVDADHSYESCLADITAWYPKIKSGKFLVGHDYRRGYGVVSAVDQFVKEKHLELIFLPPSTWAVVKK